MDELERRIEALCPEETFAGNATGEQDPESSRVAEEEKAPPPLPSVPGVKVEVDFDLLLPQLAGRIAEQPDTIHPILFTQKGIEFLDAEAKRNWISGQSQATYRLKYAKYHHKIRLLGKGGAVATTGGDFFSVAYKIIDPLLERGIDPYHTILKELAGVLSLHYQLLQAPAVDLSMLNKAISAFKQVCASLASKMRDIPIASNPEPPRLANSTT